jgi:hypothetical protein
MRLLACLLFTLSASASWACSVPVFRYALEHWPADPFQLLVVHQGPLTPEQQQLLRAADNTTPERPNLLVRHVDLQDNPPSDLLQSLKLQPPPQTPWLIARFPSSSGLHPDVFSAPLDSAAMQTLVTSPARRQIVQRLAEGESAVWVLLESGDPQADAAAEALLQDRLDYLAAVMTLPKLDESDIANGLVSVPESELRLSFSLLRVSRSDPAERVLINMLVHSEQGLDEVTEPMVFPVFGQGRALYALVGEGIRKETIESAAAFLIGKCSCQVKEQNPGVDLLLSADWQAAAKASPLLDRDLPTLAELIPAKPDAVTTRAAPTMAPAATTRPAWTLLAVAAAFVLLLGFARRLLKKT